MTSFPDAEYPAGLVAEIDDHFASGIDYGEVAIDLMDHAPDAELSFAALVEFAPHLGLDMT